MFELRLAWRNIWRNKRRTLIAGTAIGIGLAGLIFVDGLMDGMTMNLKESVTGTWMGDGQIHARGYRETFDNSLMIPRTVQWQSKLEKMKQVKTFSLRVGLSGMANSAYEARPVSLYGVDPQQEKALSEIDDAMVSGVYLEQESGDGVVIGDTLARRLEAGVGDRIVLTVTREKTGELVQELFTVQGVFHTGMNEIDRHFVIAPLSKVQFMSGSGSDVNEIALKLDPSLSGEETSAFWSSFPQDEIEAAGWEELLPQMKTVMGMKGISMAIMSVVILGVVLFGIINVMFMSLFERLFEFGVLKALGTTRARIRRLIAMESLCLGGVAVILGSLLGLSLLLLFSWTGIDYRGLDFGGATFTKMLYPVISLRPFILYSLGIWAVTGLIGLYPAGYAARLSIADAMKKSL
jgi:ABC-type lipoprotein release transport system permease subunit